MINVVDRKCELCERVPNFGHRGDTKARFCKTHKETGMVNIKNTRICELCSTTASYNYPDIRKAQFCKTHKKDGMENVTQNRCERCKKQPLFNFKGQTRGRFCATHKETGMVDVVNPACCSDGCPQQARWGLPGQKPNYCTDHRVAGTITSPRKQCVEAGCKELAVFGTTVHEHCEAHKIPGEVNIMEQRCKSCTLLGIVDADGNCETCDPAAFKRIRLAKQNMVRDFLLAQGVPLTSVDRMIDGGECGKERPDFFIDCDTHILIIEVDEHQHSGRACECEQTRMVNVSQSNGMRTVFLRWNPDTYKVPKGQTVDSTKKRLGVLLEWIEHFRKTPPESFLSVLYLFFDGYERGKEKLETMLPMEK